MGAGATLRTNCPYYGRENCGYPPGNYARGHITKYCATNNQNNPTECNYFPCQCHRCGGLVFYGQQFCPNCNIAQY